MRRFFVVLASLVLAACNPMQVMEDADGEIDIFHERWNGEEIDEIWRAAHPDFRKELTRDQFRDAMGNFEETLGVVQSSEREAFNINTHNGVTTTKITMRTQFANGEGVEKFSLRDQGGAQKIISYAVESPLINRYSTPDPDAVRVKRTRSEGSS